MSPQVGGRLVSEMASILVSCRDCGHSRVWFPSRMRQWRHDTTTTVAQLGARIVCQPCTKDGGRARNTLIEAFPDMPAREPVTTLPKEGKRWHRHEYVGP